MQAKTLNVIQKTGFLLRVFCVHKKTRNESAVFGIFPRILQDGNVQGAYLQGIAGTAIAIGLRKSARGNRNFGHIAANLQGEIRASNSATRIVRAQKTVFCDQRKTAHKAVMKVARQF